VNLGLYRNVESEKSPRAKFKSSKRRGTQAAPLLLGEGGRGTEGENIIFSLSSLSLAIISIFACQSMKIQTWYLSSDPIISILGHRKRSFVEPESCEKE
jgi:hypothetical protein